MPLPPTHESSRAPHLLARLASLSVLLAFVCFPVAARADSAGAQYQDRLPTPTGKSSEGNPSSGGGGDEAANQPSVSGGDGDATSGKGGDGKGGGAAGGGSGPGGNGGAGQAGGADGEAGIGGATATGDARDGGSGDGGSPLVPILIGIAALAAVSLGALWMMSRRQKSPSPSTRVSPGASKAR